jgi:hypothetical protein
MTPTKPAAAQPTEIIEINTSDSIPGMQQQLPERAAPPVTTTTTTTATTTVQPTILPELEKEAVAEGKDDISETNMEFRADDIEAAPEPEDAIVQHAGREIDNIEPAVVVTETIVPQPATPQQNIDQILVDTPAPIEREAAEALGDLALTRREQPVRESGTRVRRSTPTTSPPTMHKRRKMARRKYY